MPTPRPHPQIRRRNQPAPANASVKLKTKKSIPEAVPNSTSCLCALGFKAHTRSKIVPRQIKVVPASEAIVAPKRKEKANRLESSWGFCFPRSFYRWVAFHLHPFTIIPFASTHGFQHGLDVLNSCIPVSHEAARAA